ncbi:MAG TPA: hypothetical protein VMD99_15295 [Terriglobales bacterium]|nr:hypothetical protein [Terriglobales bacterium]
MHFKIVGSITNVELIASGKAIRERKRLWKAYGRGRWRKLKGAADVKFFDGTICHAEVHWYEAHGIAKGYKIKRILD